MRDLWTSAAALLAGTMHAWDARALAVTAGWTDLLEPDRVAAVDLLRRGRQLDLLIEDDCLVVSGREPRTSWEAVADLEHTGRVRCDCGLPGCSHALAAAALAAAFLEAHPVLALEDLYPADDDVLAAVAQIPGRQDTTASVLSLWARVGAPLPGPSLPPA